MLSAHFSPGFHYAWSLAQSSHKLMSFFRYWNADSLWYRICDALYHILKSTIHSKGSESRPAVSTTSQSSTRSLWHKDCQLDVPMWRLVHFPKMCKNQQLEHDYSAIFLMVTRRSQSKGSFDKSMRNFSNFSSKGATNIAQLVKALLCDLCIAGESHCWWGC